MSRPAKTSTPIRKALRTESALLPQVANGLGAVADGHRGRITEAIRSAFSDSLEIDENLRPGREQENRWDYLLGHAATACVVGLEPHSAKDEEVKTVILKRKQALEQLRPHLKDGAKVAAWFWVASGKNRFADTEKTRRLLDQNGIRFVCPELAAKDLVELAKLGTPPRRKRRGR